MGRPRDGLGPLPPSPPPDRVHIQGPPPSHTQIDYNLNQASPPSPQTRKHPRTVQLPFLQSHFVVQRPPFQMVLRKFQHGAICFPRRLAPSPLPRLPRPAPDGCYLFRLTLPNVRTPGPNLHSMLAPPLHHGGVPMVVRDHTRGGETQFRPGACSHDAVHQTHNPPLRPKKTSTLSRLKTRPEGSCSPAPQRPIPHAGMAKRPPPSSPAHPPYGPQLMGTPLVALQHVAHRPTTPLPRLPPSPPPPGQSCTQAPKAPPPPISCGTHQNSKTRPPAPKARPASITETRYRKSNPARASAPQTAAHNQGHVQPPPPP